MKIGFPPCLLGHDWTYVHGNQRVCMRCERVEVAVSSGGGWGNWREVGGDNKRRIEDALRYEKAKYLLLKAGRK